MTIRFTVNGMEREFAGDGDMPLLWYLRDHARLTGTKYGCGAGLCGACAVLVDGEARRSCVVPVSALAGSVMRTIEGLGASGPHPVQKAWIEEDVAQCGNCQTGQIMAATALNLEFTIEDGRVQQSNFDDYPLATMAQMPHDVEVIIVDPAEAPSGCGEMGIPTAAPALMNAIHAACGVRLKRLPVRGQLRAALARAT